MSSSSDDEDDVMKRRLLEAASEELIDHMNKKKDSKPPKKKNIVDKPSLRKNGNEESDKQFELTSTPEFKSFISKKLSSYLDGIIEIQKNSNITKPNNTQDLDNCGIKLLQSSESFLKEANDRDILNLRLKQSEMKKRSTALSSDESSDEEERLKFASVCMTGDTILKSGEGAFRRCVNKNTKLTNHNRLTTSGDINHNIKPKKKKRKKSEVTT
uniref:protein CUSTOS-like n=1 Tax=Styela clava TaxID=7725 RepID=UPI00193A9E7C|nr:protein CUSTOS-like [Styela clava]